MPQKLTFRQVDQFWRDGFIHPICVMSEDGALALRSRLEAFERSTGGPLKGDLRHKSHLLFVWLAELVHATTWLRCQEAKSKARETGMLQCGAAIVWWMTRSLVVPARYATD